MGKALSETRKRARVTISFQAARSIKAITQLFYTFIINYEESGSFAAYLIITPTRTFEFTY